MNIGWDIFINAIGALGWLLLIREGLQRYVKLSHSTSRDSNAFQIQHYSKPLGRIRLVTVNWQDVTYCLAVDMQGSYVQLIDKRPTNQKEPQ